MVSKNNGKDFEDLIHFTNLQYEKLGLAIIQRIPTPWKVIRSWENGSKKSVINRAFPEQKSTVDFGGTAKGQSIWFDAKHTIHERNFALKNIKEHQIDFLMKVEQHGGKAFFLIYSSLKQKVWLVWIGDILRFRSEEERKSIPYEWFDENCKLVHANVNIPLDYLKEVLA